MENFDIIRNQENENPDKFWKAIKIFMSNSHTVNRRILVSSDICIYKLQNADFKNILQLLYYYKNEWRIKEIDNIIVKIFEKANICIESTISNVNDIDFDIIENHTVYLRVAKVLPRDTSKIGEYLEFSLFDVKEKCVTLFYSYDLDERHCRIDQDFEYPFQICCYNNHLTIKVEYLERWKNEKCLGWLKNQLFNKIVKWMENDLPKNNLINGSLKLISPEKYLNLYNHLKKKYGKKMVEIWPENTDPLKFVYEDVAIATYLLLLWEDERKKLNSEKLQSFLDLGCGNGLLVYILSSEGHPGIGIDLRKRKIWDIYPSCTSLKVQTIIPSAQSLFPEADWIIGNHSDELTPWIPVISFRSSYQCRFFLLPCCAYEFNGKKYQRDNSVCSQYFEYVNYIKDISTMCGFQTFIDRLRIPSTKRICLVGSGRTYPEKDFLERDRDVQDFIRLKSDLNGDEVNGNWSSTFKPRCSVEKVKNCTQIDPLIRTKIINIVAGLILEEKNIQSVGLNHEKLWNAGRVINLKEISASIPDDLLKKIKNENGGIQTLLKNNSHIFKVQSGDVSFKILDQSNNKVNRKRLKPIQRKTKDCWFYSNHPDGCPLNDVECNFKH